MRYTIRTMQHVNSLGMRVERYELLDHGVMIAEFLYRDDAEACGRYFATLRQEHDASQAQCRR